MSQAVVAANPADLIRPELEEVERVLADASRSEIEVLQEAARHILSAGGKRVRPQLALLAARALGGSLKRTVPLAAACELVHTATLVHDDIVDESDSRRGRMAVQFYFGNSASVLMGDYLVVRSFGLVVNDPERQLWQILVDTIARMCEGEVLQICVKGDTGIEVDVYETIIECKTALLISTCTRFGALVAGAPPEIEQALTDFGYNIGMAFQIQDDILDFLGDEQTLGKPVGGDLREGKVTLPVIYALQEAHPEDRAELLRIYDKASPLSADEVRRATEIIEIAGGFRRAREHAWEYVRRSKRSLDLVPESESRDALQVLADHIVDRWN
ncbi:MAG: Geranylgeranyl pyrophosphate synthase [Armatimonadetes bacterium]|jgi:geranylgeranyl pyrophosphate synthase|nr:Geranylgeranyl pyrophosphate synthase [Armatimonadota bacterium]